MAFNVFVQAFRHATRLLAGVEKPKLYFKGLEDSKILYEKA
jgi:hypothetical protein